MSSYRGVSLIRDGSLWHGNGRLWPSPSDPTINDAGAGYHLLVVQGYSRTKADVPNGRYIESRRFRVGGYLWYLCYYPNGLSTGYHDFVSVSLVLAQEDVAVPVKGRFAFSVESLDGADDQSLDIRFVQVDAFPSKPWSICQAKFRRKDVLQNSKHLKDDTLTIRCEVVLVTDAAKATSQFVTVPPPDMQRHFTDLLNAKEGTDVMFNVGGETFAAHRCVLAARSRVFKAEPFGPMKEGAATADLAIHLEDMKAKVFEAMLAFIYSDSEPAEPEKLGDDEEDVIWFWQQLLVVADRYDLQRLKLMCEDKLCGFIDVNTATDILALAERHACDGLKKACRHFLCAPGNNNAFMAFLDSITADCHACT